MLQTRERTEQRGTRPGGAPVPRASGTVIPYDYAARFELNGTPGRVVHDAISISAEGVFVAVAVGYGFEEERGESVEIATGGSGSIASSTTPIVPGDVRLGDLPLRAVIDGFRINPRLHSLVFNAEWIQAGGTPTVATLLPQLTNDALPLNIVRGPTRQLVIERLRRREEISFLFNVLDTGSGRELQDEPIHNLASLGKSNGERPFRLLAHPLTFLPRSSIRVQVIEQSRGAKGTLFIVFYGYKMLAPGCDEPVMRSLRGIPGCPTETIGRPTDRVIPFDYVATLELAGQHDRLVETEVALSTEEAFVATALGYGLAAAEPSDVRVQRVTSATATGSSINLRRVSLRRFPPDALVDGIRIKPDFIRIAVGTNGRLSRNFPASLLDQVFERRNRPEDVSFRYLIIDAGRGIELQNQFIHNIAGLGSADGDRPFKKFARPMVFGPRSTIRVSVRERFGRGTLQLVFQGYKILHSPDRRSV